MEAVLSRERGVDARASTYAVVSPSKVWSRGHHGVGRRRHRRRAPREHRSISGLRAVSASYARRPSRKPAGQLRRHQRHYVVPERAGGVQRIRDSGQLTLEPRTESGLEVVEEPELVDAAPFPTRPQRIVVTVGPAASRSRTTTSCPSLLNNIAVVNRQHPRPAQ